MAGPVILRDLLSGNSIASLWERDFEIRQRARATGKLVLRGSDEPDSGPCKKIVANARLNKVVLLPLLHRMGETEFKLPTVDLLLTEVADFHSQVHLSPDDCYNVVWSLRKLLQLVKARLYKPHPPSSEDRIVTKLGLNMIFKGTVGSVCRIWIFVR